MSPTELEIDLNIRDADSYSIDLRFLDPASAADKRLNSDAAVYFDLALFRASAAWTLMLTEHISAETLTRLRRYDASCKKRLRRRKHRTYRLDYD